ncbi:Collagen alpha-1(XVIII) chain Endostatin Non-collagenous domain 1 [Larimichthys crocea]|uniref:Collagen alpha-1(XVIII) chain Endostatin Non-collagenous domain 1 n=1 Tax=Larimichthys crocea TaxID=215358 RepID=A0A6G0J7Q1_LARCR|nr:Collagen alpha-1(XVIII) chain Endostatin Non-collagenous domain 1 [Larimichthys crocea]
MRTQFGVLFLLALWVAYSDAWFWSWTGTTTLPPTVENEGSGSPAGSGEPPSEDIARVGAEIIDEGHGIQKVVQTRDETTQAPQLTTTTQPKNERVSEKAPAGISSRIHKPEDSGVSLLQLIGDPPPSEITQVYGPDNSPGYVFGPDANTGQLARAHLPSPFYRDFALIFNLKPTSDRGGVIFSVTDASQQIMYVGVKLSAVEGGSQNVILYYTEPDSQRSYEGARFRVPSMKDTWTRFAIAVRDEKVMFYLNCDIDPQVMRIERSPDEMELEAGAGVFVGQAGGADPEKFLGVIGELRVVGDPRAAERHCEEDEDDSDVASGEGSGYRETRPSNEAKEKPRWTTTPPSSRPIQQPPLTRKEEVSVTKETASDSQHVSFSVESRPGLPGSPGNVLFIVWDGQLGLKEKGVTEGIEERKETGVLLGRRENLVLAQAHEVEPVEKRENQEKREQREVQALAIKERRESPALQGRPVLLGLQGLQMSIQSAVMDQLLPGSLDHEDHQVPQGPRDQQELMESQVILVRMEKLVLMDHEASQESQETLDSEERREIVEMVSLAPGDHQDHQDPQDLDSDLLLWTWKVQGFQIWNLFGDCQACQVLLAPLVLLVLLLQAQDLLLGHLDHQERMEHPVNLACPVCQVLMEFQEFLVPKEKRVTQASWVFQEQLERRELKENLV